MMELSLRNHVENVICSYFYQLRQLRYIRQSLTFDAAHSLVHAFKRSQVNYYNAILVGVSDGVTRKLQSILHAAVHLESGIRWNKHITSS